MKYQAVSSQEKAMYFLLDMAPKQGFQIALLDKFVESLIKLHSFRLA
jgi:hypothetical protein